MYVELNCKSNFSFLRGASDSREYVMQAHLLGHAALGITDINGVYALPRAFEMIRDYAPHLQLISGAEVRLENHPPVQLLAQTRKGYALLCRILTQVHAGKEKGQGFITLPELISLGEQFPGQSDLVALASPTEGASLGILKEIFKGNLFLTLCRYLDGLDRERTEETLRKSKEFDIPIVAHNDVHYHDARRRPLQDSLTCIREGVTMDTAGFHLFGNGERYLKSPQQMKNLFPDLPEALQHTLQIAESCQFKLSELKYTYPREFIPPGQTPRTYLRELVYQGAHKTYQGLIPTVASAQIERELQFFAERDLEHYFLTVQDIVQFAEKENIICQGRGSAANSIVCYVLGITSVDPIAHHLLFDRFMNAGRNEPPDIDVDFEHERREEIIQYIYRRFGRDRAAMVSAVPTYRRKNAFRELSKALGIPVGAMSAGELENRFDELSADKKYRRPYIESLCEEIKGFPRHLSIHSGGFVLSDDPLVEIVPVEPARMENRTIVQWDKQDLETLGLMKVDVLSIGFLTALHKATDLAGVSWRGIPDNDKQTFEMIRRAETHGTFQIESRAQMAMLVQTLPENYYDLVIEVALVRPSPTEGGMIQPYLKGRALQRKGIPFKIGHAGLEKILGRTCGVPIFQEQIMQISIEVAGFNPVEADQLRRALAQQRSADSIEKVGERFYQALMNRGVTKQFADQLFKYIKGYAHYGFPESHAASYASLAYKSAYMKCHHPAELLCGLINSQPMGFYSIDTLMNEARRNGVIIRPIDPNLSEWNVLLEEPKTLRMGFRNIRQINKSEIENLLREREKKKFHSLEDFIARTQLKKEAITSLAKADAFKIFGLDRRHTFWKSLEFSLLSKSADSLQMSLFNEQTELAVPEPIFDPLRLSEEILMDYKNLGYSNHGQVMKGLREDLPELPPLRSDEVRQQKIGEKIRYAGILTALQCPPPAKGTAFITLEDERGSVDLILRKEVYDKYRKIVQYSRLMIVEGKLQRRGLGYSVLVSHVEVLEKFTSRRPTNHGETGRSLDIESV